MLAWRRTEDLLPEGDYTDTQLDRAQQQVLVLVAYYDKLLKANELGVAYSVYECAEAAAGVLGDGFNVTHRTVRAWSAQYIKTGGKTQPDGRGYYERELLINEEDLKRRFVKWSLRSAKSDELSVEAAREWINHEIMGTLPAEMLKAYKMRPAISSSTAWRWMQVCEIYRSKFTQSYYNDKHQDPEVVKARERYINIMDDLMLRQPLWVHLTAHEYNLQRERFPPLGGVLVHKYIGQHGLDEYEVHVDLCESLDREAIRLGGRWSVRFPGGRPSDRPWKEPPADLPDPGRDAIEPPEPPPEADEADGLANGAAGDDTSARGALPACASASHRMPMRFRQLSAIDKLKMPELQEELAARKLSKTGNKPSLIARLKEDELARHPPTGDGTGGEDPTPPVAPPAIREIIDVRENTVVDGDHTFFIREYLVLRGTDADGASGNWISEYEAVAAEEAMQIYMEKAVKQDGCNYDHVKGVCRCDRPLLFSGQDESIFKQWQKSSFQWVVGGVRGLRKKTDGPGEMVSGFKDEQRGFGVPMTADELAGLNAMRRAKRKSELSASPAVRFLMYGKGKEGYWTFAHFSSQVDDVLDMYEYLYPGAQVAIEVDWSSGHSAHRPGALNTNSMGVKMGGKQATPRPSKMSAGCLGDGAVLKVGDIQHFAYRAGDPPPHFEPNVTEYIGKAKGKRQILWERGLWKVGMVEFVDDDDPKGRDQSMSMDYMLSLCEDFMKEKTALQAMVEARGHILVMSPKGHCELAGQGIEYDWGKMKQTYRRNNRYEKDFHEMILKSMGRDVLKLSTSRKFARKARAYRRAYREGCDNEHACIEQMVKQFKAHRNAADFAGKFIAQA